MRIRRNPSRMLDLSFHTTAQVQPKASPSEERVLLPPVLSPSQIDFLTTPALPAAAPLEVCLQSYAWTSHPHALNSKELNDGLAGDDAWREPREIAGLADIDVDFVLHQQEVETEAEVGEEIFLLRKKKVGDKAGKQQLVNEELKQDGNQQKKKGPNKKMMAMVTKEEVVTAKSPLKCKKSDGRKWKCGKDAAVPHTLCEKHLRQSRSYYDSRKEAPGASSKSALEKSSSKRARASAPSPSTEARALVSDDVLAGSKAARSQRPRKKKEDDYSGGAFHYP